MKEIGDFLDLLSGKLASATGMNGTLAFVIVLVVGIWIVIRILRWIFGGSSSSSGTTNTPTHNSTQSYSNQEREASRERQRLREKEERDRRAREIHQAEILKGRRDTEDW